MTKKLQRRDKRQTKGLRQKKRVARVAHLSKQGETFERSNDALCEWNKTKKAMKLSTADHVICGYNA
jgi:hypothetical protein